MRVWYYLCHTIVPNNSADEAEWIVKSIVDHRKAGRKLEWLVLWDGGQQSWEPRNCFVDADQSKNEVWADYEKKRLNK